MSQRPSPARTRACTPPPLPATGQSTPPRRDEIFRSLKNPKVGVYIGTAGLPKKASFYLGGTKGDVLVSKQTKDTELILHGVFNIDRTSCWLSPDGAYKPNNQYQSRFEDVKLSCMLTIPTHSDFQFMSNDMDTVFENMKGFEDLITTENDDTLKLTASGGEL